MSVETATQSIGSTIGSSVEAMGSSAISTFPAPEVPTSIISQISKPAGLESLDMPPSSLTGNFDIGDIIAGEAPRLMPLNRHGIETIRIEPAVFLNPKIVEEIYKPKDRVDDLPLAEESLVIQKAEDEESKKKEESEIAVNRFPRSKDRGSLILAQNKVALAEAYSLLETLGFTEENTESWKKKLAGATSVNKQQEELTQTEHRTETEAETNAEIQIDTVINSASDQQPPQLPVAEGGSEEEEPTKKVEAKYEQENWLAYVIRKKEREATDVNIQKQKLASEVSQQAYSEENPRVAVEKSIGILDTPTTYSEAEEIAIGDLKVPSYSDKIYVALSDIDPSKPQVVANVVIQTVKNHPAIRIHRTVESTEVVEPERFSPDARELIAKGAEKLVFKRKWKAVKRLRFRENLEAEKIKDEKKEKTKAKRIGAKAVKIFFLRQSEASETTKAA